MRRIRLIIAYEGTEYVGWQTQGNGTAVQSVIEEAIFLITGERVSLQGSGRTDSGVHARAQVAHFDTAVRMPADKFAFALNTRLPEDIRIVYSDEAPEEFHSRFSAKEKEYRYCLYLSPHADVFSRRFSLHVHSSLDIDKMRAAASLFPGEHDLAAFKSTGTTVATTVRTLYTSEWLLRGNRLEYRVSGNGFMYNTVRIMVGTMLGIGMGTLPDDAVAKALLSRDRNDAGPTAPACGLTLWRVRYPGFDTEEHIPYDE